VAVDRDRAPCRLLLTGTANVLSLPRLATHWRGASNRCAASAGRHHRASLDIFWLEDESLADSDTLPPPEVIAQEIVEDPEAAL
jgi:hypothetical protein